VKRRTFVNRHELIARVRARLVRNGAPRVQLGAIVALCGCAALISSIVGLRLGLDAMALRYPLAVVCGYVTFLLLIRSWIGWQRRCKTSTGHPDLAADLASHLDFVDVTLPAKMPVPSGPSLFAAGRSGGAGGGAQWTSAFSSAPSGGPSSASTGAGVSLDLEELWFVVVAVACALGGVIAIAYVIYAAPLLLAEVALDAAVVSAVYRRMRREDASHWCVTVVKHTWLPVLALVIFAAIGGYALQRLVPEARSIGGVVRALGD
jgi:hypothetical protein